MLFTEITVKNLKIEYKTEGKEDGIPVLLLHGWGSSYDAYAGIISALSDRCKIFALNFPGCKNSEIMEKPWNLDDYCDLVVEFLEKVKIKNPVLIGHSHGGRVILKLAATKRLNPPKIVLLDSAGLIPKKSLKQKLRAKSFKIIKRTLTLPVIKSFSGELLERVRNYYGSADYNAAPLVLRQTLVSLVNTDLRDIIGAISCPTLLIWGENDTATPLEDAKIIESLIRDSGLCVIKNAGHYSFLDNPYQTAAILNSFIK